jgi:hypothetical protein
MPQDSRHRRRERKRRAKKNRLWDEQRVAEDTAADKPKAPPKKAT